MLSSNRFDALRKLHENFVIPQPFKISVKKSGNVFAQSQDLKKLYDEYFEVRKRSIKQTYPQRIISDSDVHHAISHTNIHRIIAWINQKYGLEEATRRSLEGSSTTSMNSSLSKDSRHKSSSLWQNANTAAKIIAQNTTGSLFNKVRSRIIEIAKKNNYPADKLVEMYYHNADTEKEPIKLGVLPIPENGRYLSSLYPKTLKEKQEALKDFRQQNGLG